MMNQEFDQTRVILVRHGQSTYNEQKRYQGCCDESLLTQKGKQQAFQTGIALSKIKFDAIYTSPLKRTRQTAWEIFKVNNFSENLNSKLSINSNLKEVYLPGWQGLQYKYVREEFAEEYRIWEEQPHEFTTENTESNGHTLIKTRTKPVLQLYKKAEEFWQEILPLHRGKTILVVSHGGTIRALIGTATGIHPQKYHSIQQSNSGINILNFGNSLPGQFVKIEAINQTQHLGEVLPKLKNGKYGLRLLLLPVFGKPVKGNFEKISRFLRSTELDFCISNNNLDAQLISESIIEKQPSPPVNLQVSQDNFLDIWHQTISKRSQNHHSLNTGLVVADKNTISSTLAQVIGVKSPECLQLNQGEISILFYPISQNKPVLQAMNITGIS
ncbi:fructose-2,6-bisphosphatase [Rivularia sp. PCC 7116]|uniref:histidine phosphatase family protein n=1 Tax=Rivularia sp. PCC 7116 TaxID=373994 RepID=UPI00029F27F5|nr:histidine phosphatase family protein [Rivularia sp. PCC 7116]AFY54978.1 fructose-2,6-bisphosphatase [Rivularia sp. PCC 7116]